MSNYLVREGGRRVWILDRQLLRVKVELLLGQLTLRCFDVPSASPKVQQHRRKKRLRAFLRIGCGHEVRFQRIVRFLIVRLIRFGRIRHASQPSENLVLRPTKEKYPTGKALKSFGGLCPSVNFIRYADDFVITGRSKELLEGEVKPLVEQFLQQRGLELSPKKTVITHVEKGFDFLGQNVRRYPNGKLLIKPSKKNVKTFLDGIGRIIKASIGRSAADLIGKLNPKIRGWANYHRHVVSKHTFVHLDSIIFSRIWQWARRRHPKKSSDWLKKRYFGQRRGRDWSFFSETCDDEGQPGKLWLHRASSTPIKRHIKVKGEANPYDPAYETYFEKREADHMQDTFRGTRTLRFLWNEQRGLCPICSIKITRNTGWRAHYCVPRVLGGLKGAGNRVLLHPECHDRVHRQRISVSKPRLPERGVRRA
jgi:RNA-directed DNA polymerase